MAGALSRSGKKRFLLFGTSRSGVPIGLVVVHFGRLLGIALKGCLIVVFVEGEVAGALSRKW